MFVSAVQGGPAAEHGLKPGDIIEAVDGAPPFVAGVADRGIGYALSQQYPRHDPVTLALRRPATGRTWTVTLTPEQFTPTPESTRLVTSTLLDGDVAGIRLAAFLPGAADTVLAAVADLRRGRTLRGVVLDLRGNPGGAPEEVARLVGAFAHGKVWSWDCDRPGHCPYAHRTDDSVPLLGLPLAVLTDRDCGSACDAFSGAVKDLRLGTLVGTRTAGVVAGPAQAYLLDDGSALGLPSRHQLGARHEMIDGIGVAPDRYLPLTPADLSAGRDPALAEAVRLLRD
jgi:carboxyl-terminal processing protease